MSLFDKAFRLTVAASATALTLMSVAARAETAATTTAPASQATVAAQAPATVGKMTGSIELRPNVWLNSNNKVTNDTTLELGYKFSPSVSMAYYQGLENMLSDPSAPAVSAVPSLTIGFLQTKVGNIWKNETGTSLSYENRIYVPVDSGSQNRGLLTIMRNYLKLTQKINDNLSVTLSEIPIVHAYGRAGNYNDKGELSANPVFENRVYLIGSAQITEKLSLTVPVMFHVTVARDLPGAANSNGVSYYAWIWPELGYQINDQLSVGAAFMSDNLVSSSNASLALGSGLGAGAVQVFVGASL